MPVAQHAFNLALGGKARFFRLRRDHGIGQPLGAIHLFLHRSIGHEDHVVLIVSHGDRRALDREYADHAEWQRVDAHSLPHRIGCREQVLAYGVADHRHVSGGLYIVLGEVGAFVERPGTDIQILRLGTSDAGIPVVIAKNYLG